MTASITTMVIMMVMMMMMVIMMTMGVIMMMSSSPDRVATFIKTMSTVKMIQLLRAAVRKKKRKDQSSVPGVM